MKREVNMSDKGSTIVKSSIGVLGLLQVAFIILKILKVIEWSWFWVFIPLWIDIAGTIIILAIFFIVYYLTEK